MHWSKHLHTTRATLLRGLGKRRFNEEELGTRSFMHMTLQQALIGYRRLLRQIYNGDTYV